ncbi:MULTISPECIES: iron-containing alcohol dehydrogenase family protein [Cupriavidus]|uniref:iron-containing alcohol dehydrogenase family protein n=1 Tax=Cupriavidus TaxID=106589 RepID=UPI001CC5EAA6|nr:MULTISPECIES: iron-containing alcohol dehydrogenase [Cupriavidus]
MWKFNSAGQIVFGAGAIARLPVLVQRLGGTRVALVTDPGLEAAGLLGRVVDVLKTRGIAPQVFAQALPEPDMASVRRCRDALADTRPDLLIALGGGSCIDLAKIVATWLTHGGQVADYYGENKLPGPVMPIIAIPTTAGTGSEVSPVAIVTDDQLHMKVGLSDNRLRPAVALLDPELTLKLPPPITAATGMDALTQAIEGYYGKDHRWVEAEGDPIYQGANPMSDLLAERAIALIAEHLPVAVHQGANLEARSGMLLGNILSALAFSNSGVSWVHAVAYPIADVAPRPHGELVGLLLPWGMRYNAPAAPDKLARIGELLGAPAQASREARIEAGIARVFSLLDTLGLPSRLSSIGVRAEHIEDIVERSLGIERLNRLNPRRPTREALVALLQEAL